MKKITTAILTAWMFLWLLSPFMHTAHADPLKVSVTGTIILK